MEAESTVTQYLKAFNNHDVNAVAEHYTPDAVIEDPQYPQPLRGRDAARKDTEDFIKAFPDIQFQLRGIVSKGDVAALDGVATGTHRGPLEGPAGTIEATNKSIQLRFAVFVRVNDQGKIVEEHRYYDLAGMMAQLGLMPGA